MKKKITIIVGGVGILMLSIIFLLNNNKSVDAIGYEIVNTAYKDVISSVGIVEYDKQIQIKAEVSGTLLEVYKDVGDKILTGEQVAKIDNSEALITYEEIKINSALSKARYEDYMNSYYKNEESISDQKSLQVNEIASINLEQSQLNMKIVETKILVDEGILPLNDLSDLNEQMSMIKLKIESANTKLKSLRSPVLAVQEFKTSINAAFESIAKQELELNKYLINAPISGIIVEQLVEAGTFIQAGEVILEIASDSEKYAVVEIDEKYISKVSLGKEVQILIEAYPDEIVKGIVEIISPEVDKDSGTIRLKVRIIEKKELFLKNMAVKIEFVSEVYNNAIVIPGEYLINGENSSVFIKDDNGIAIKKEIVIYNKNASNIMVLEGLSAGDLIINPNNLEEGIKVKVVLSVEGDSEL